MWFFSSPLVTADSSVVRPYLMKSSEPAYKKRRCDKPSSVDLIPVQLMPLMKYSFKMGLYGTETGPISVQSLQNIQSK